MAGSSGDIDYSKILNYGVCASDYVGELEDIRDNPRMQGFPLPEGTLRQALGRKMQPGKVTLLAGHSNHGKSILAQQISIYAAEAFRDRNKGVDETTGEILKPQAVVYFTVEMGWVEIISRALSQVAGAIPDRLANPDLMDSEDWGTVRAGLELVKDLPIYIVDEPMLTITMIEKYLQALRREADIRLVVVDYLQIMDSSGSSETESLRLKSVAMRLKHISRLIDTHMIVISSLNQSGDGFLPTLANIRNSGDIVYSVDIVAFLHQPFVADRRVGDMWKDVAVFTVGKNRGGTVGQYNLKWDVTHLRFGDMEEFDESNLPDLPSSKWGGRK